LALFGAGIFAYTFSKGIWLTISMGTSWQDWQWYLPLTLLLALPLLQVALRWFGKRFRLFYLVLLLWILVGFNGFGYEEAVSVNDAPPIKLSFWAGRIEVDDTRLLEQLQTAVFSQQKNPPNVRGLIGDAEAPRLTPFDSFRSDISPVLAAANEMESFLSDYQQTYPDLPIGVTAAWPLHLDKTVLTIRPLCGRIWSAARFTTWPFVIPTNRSAT